MSLSSRLRSCVCLCLSVTAAQAADAPVVLRSPDGKLELQVAVVELGGVAGAPTYRVLYRGHEIIAPSRLGFELKDGPPLDRGFRIVKAAPSTFDETWTPVCGERSRIRNHYAQTVIDLEDNQQPPRRMQLQCRAYDEGIAFCYVIPRQPAVESLTIAAENTQFRFTGNHTAWATYSAQGIYEAVGIDQVKPNCERPLTVEIPNGPCVALAEARLVDFARMRLQPAKGAPHAVQAMLGSEVKAATPLTTPWRVVMVADTPGQLLERNDLLLNLNAPCAIADTSWIKPGKVIREVTLTTAGGKACIDFAVAQGLQYVEYDAGWYGHEYEDSADARRVNRDPKKSSVQGELDLHEVIRYGAERGVGVVLYVNRRALERQLDELLPLYQQWGVKGVKYGFVQVGSQQWTAWLHEAIRKAAAHKLMVDVHDEYRGTGYCRTYPNLMTVEGVHGNECMPAAENNLALPFTRFLCGPADFTICWHTDRNKNTRAHQLAIAVVYFSPWQFMFWYDRPQQFHGEPELEFFKRVPTTWDDTRVLQGKIGQYITVARRSGDDWYLGTMNAGQRRTLEVPLDFLDAGRRWQAVIYSDAAPEGGNLKGVKIESRAVGTRTVLTADLAANGGQAVRIAPLLDETAAAADRAFLDTGELTSRGLSRFSGHRRAAMVGENGTVPFRDQFPGEPDLRGTFGFVAAATTPPPEPDVFEQTIRPMVKGFCADCHTGADAEGGVRLEKYPSAAEATADRATWLRVLKMLRGRKMPPDDNPKPPEDDWKAAVAWLDATLNAVDCTRPDPGRVTIRRLNRVEYANTIRDLLGVEFQAAADFPADDVGYGFDNIGDVLSLPPLLMEKYMAAAEQIAAKAIVADRPNARPDELPESHRRIMAPAGEKLPPAEAAGRVLRRLALRAYRRPPTDKEIERLVGLVKLAEQQGDSFAAGIQLALRAVLVSPHFLFKVELDPQPNDVQTVRTLGDYELATRLSYFLWSSMPDEELFALAEKGQLRPQLDAQLRRMLADAKSQALVENFAGQWLQLRNLETISPNRQRFPTFNEDLCRAMRTEAEMCFAYVVRENRSLLELLDADYTFVNGPLAKHYGLSGVEGAEFRRVSLRGPEASPAVRARGGVLTQASMLSVTSNPTRTSAVKRGKWVLENVLGTPPPEPPPNVPMLRDDPRAAAAASLRERLEQHRKDPNCAVCHKEMDALGFALENFDPVGAWRTKDGRFDIDPSGELPDGRKFAGPAELKAVLGGNRELFVCCLTEKMLTYALGRGLEPFDKCAVDRIVKDLAADQFKSAALLRGIVRSDPFQKRRGKGP